MEGGYAERESGTIHLRGWHPYDKREVSIKYYNVGLRSRLPDLPLYKLGVTLYNQYFKRKASLCMSWGRSLQFRLWSTMTCASILAASSSRRSASCDDFNASST